MSRTFRPALIGEDLLDLKLVDLGVERNSVPRLVDRGVPRIVEASAS